MKKYALTLMLSTLIFSSAVFANCIDGLTDQSVKYCSGSQVYISTVGGEVVGPVLLKTISSANKAIVKIEGTNFTKKVVPSVMVAVDNGCTQSKDICVGSVVTNINNGIDFKVVGRFENNIVAAAACLNDSCDVFAANSNYDIIREYSVNDLIVRN